MDVKADFFSIFSNGGLVINVFRWHFFLKNDKRGGDVYWVLQSKWLLPACTVLSLRHGPGRGDVIMKHATMWSMS